ncbi:thiol-disulfide isomerase/thioredoxin [Kribbella orskensis]|uniref:Thiol-disulfide isomerase/thioredoxin n=1 Tax=Kribbella orskensis TaxID=2512216 RepID=A0ABY2BL87_9ACTN|nr:MULTISPECIES: thioredoxin family protein [Kribbella]TCN40887.1 thiol-disulfide isomerase/thioredoxin [Kribbella sp. VKM Ac-2500]TCO24139.1 thiol-disulfide isomerase/thioredoxin [Kribbella orskensis]
MSPGIIVLIGAVVIGVALSVFKSRFDGRFRGTRPVKVAGRAEVQETATQATPDQAAQVGAAQVGTEHVGAARGTADHDDDAERLTAGDIGEELGERATLLQFSSAFCAPCRATRRTLAEVESMVEGVRHVELDAESHLDLVRRLDILRTPTVLVLDATGAIVTRASGQPRKPDVIAALGAAVDRQPH